MTLPSQFRTPLGVALAPDRLTVVVGAEARERTLLAWDGGPTWPDLAATLRELAGEADGRALAVALLPPLVQARMIELPRLPAAARSAVLQRDVLKHFPVGHSEFIVDGAPTGGAGSPEALLAAAAPEPLLVALFAAAAEAGLEIATVVPAEAAWFRLVPQEGDGAVVIATEAGEETLVVQEGRLLAIRRRPLELTGGIRLGEGQAAVAAREVSNVIGPLLLPVAEWERRARQERSIRRRGWLGVAAAFLLAATFELIGLRRDLALLRARRAEIRPQVQTLLVTREAAQDIETRLQVLDSLDATRPRWVAAFGRIATGLPRQAYLTGLRGTPDSLVLEGVAPEASLVFEALRSTPGVVSVRAEAPYRQETRDDGRAIEHFAFGTRWAPGSANGGGQ